MPHTQSAAKRLRQNEQRRLRNKARITEIKSLRKQIERAVHDGQPAKAQELYRDFTQRVDQAASVNTLHANRAARLKGRVAVAIAKPPAAKPAT
jgi:small subunit ribosomal protein S20